MVESILDASAYANSFPESAIGLVCAKDQDAWSLLTKVIADSGNEIDAYASDFARGHAQKSSGVENGLNLAITCLKS